MANLQTSTQCAGDGMCIDPRCPRHSPPEMRAICDIRIEAPPSIALAIMALDLASHRLYGTLWSDSEPVTPVARKWACAFSSAYPATFAFYQILDRISAGEQP